MRNTLSSTFYCTTVPTLQQPTVWQSYIPPKHCFYSLNSAVTVFCSGGLACTMHCFSAIFTAKSAVLSVNLSLNTYIPIRISMLYTCHCCHTPTATFTWSCTTNPTPKHTFCTSQYASYLLPSIFRLFQWWTTCIYTPKIIFCNVQPQHCHRWTHQWKGARLD